jgi:hypothetical protein
LGGGQGGGGRGMVGEAPRYLLMAAERNTSTELKTDRTTRGLSCAQRGGVGSAGKSGRRMEWGARERGWGGTVEVLRVGHVDYALLAPVGDQRQARSVHVGRDVLRGRRDRARVQGWLGA